MADDDTEKGMPVGLVVVLALVFFVAALFLFGIGPPGMLAYGIECMRGSCYVGRSGLAQAATGVWATLFGTAFLAIAALLGRLGVGTLLGLVLPEFNAPAAVEALKWAAGLVYSVAAAWLFIL